MANFLLDPDICFLNHGSFGATPEELLQVQDEFRRALEREPIDFLARKLPDLLAQARKAVADFIGAEPDGLVFVQNATSGVNAVLSSLSLGAGDTILTTNHRYDAVRFTLDRWAAQRGAKVNEAEVPFPIASHDDVLQAIARAWTEDVRLLVVDHITSPTALIFPVAKLVKMARDRGVPVLVDGAHAPGQIDLDIKALGADFWVGNLHKWLCAPKGTAVLCMADKWRDIVHPPVTSHGYALDLHTRFDWCGTFDPSAWLTAPAAIALHQTLGDAQFRAQHHALVQTGRAVLAEALGVELPHPDDPTLYGSMATIPIPLEPEHTRALNDTLREKDQIEVPIIAWRGQSWVRISGFAGYNHPGQYEELAATLQRRLG
jgi:isopenicillin-N epimerase